MTRRPILLTVVHYMPDFPSVTQEFYWQTEDELPELARIHRFLNHWKSNIEAPIHGVLVSVEDKYKTQQYRNVSHLLTMQ